MQRRSRKPHEKGEHSMPFISSDFTFTEHMILAVASRSSDVYGIKGHGTGWIYVGEAQDIEERLLSHIRGESDQSARILRSSPTHFVFEQVPGEVARKNRERALIQELSPACNRM
jgi:excinuclease UvrABC nuclease subunit